MFSYANRMNAICIILTTVHGIATFLGILFLLTLHLGFAITFTVLLYLLSTNIGLICLCVNIRGLCQDLQLESDSTADRISKLTKRVKELEELSK